MDNRTEPLPGGAWRIEVAPSTNAYLIARDGRGDEEGLVLIDTGTRAAGPRLVRSVRLLGFDPRRIDQVALTHWHRAHAGSAARLAASSASPMIRAGAADAAVLSGAAPPAAGRRTRTGRALQARPRLPDRTDATAIEDGEECAPGLRAIAAPGHTAGHLAFWLPRAGLLLAGDAIHHVLRCSAGPRSWHADLDAGARTLRRLADLEPAVVACGHGPPVRKAASARLSDLADRASAALVP